MKNIREFDEVYEDYLSKYKDYLSELLSHKNNYKAKGIAWIAGSFVVIIALVLLFYYTSKNNMIDGARASVILYSWITFMCIVDLGVALHYYVMANKIPNDVEKDIEHYFVKQIFTEIFPNYEYYNCHREILSEFNDVFDKLIGKIKYMEIDEGDNYQLEFKESRIVEKVTTQINGVPITIYGVEEKCIVNKYETLIRHTTYAVGTQEKIVNGHMKVEYAEEYLPVGVDEFTDYYKVETDGKIDEGEVLTPNLKEAFVNARDGRMPIDLYIEGRDFIIDICGDNHEDYIDYNEEPIRHWETNQYWAKERYNVYKHIYNVIDELTK